MSKLIKALNSWGTDEFSRTLKQEIETLESGILPLELAICQGGQVDDSDISALINRITENETTILVKVGIFFHEIIAGCNCGDDPMAENTYCEILVSIDKITADTDFVLTSP